MRKHRKSMPGRSGYTLVELIVVMMIIMVLATLAVAFLPSITEQERSAKGASMAQGHLMIGRQMALRDQLPSGLRLAVNQSLQSTCPNMVTELQVIQQPPDYSVGQLVSLKGNNATFSGVDFTGGGLPQQYAPVQEYDFLEVSGCGVPHRIINQPGQSTLQLVPVQAPNQMPQVSVPTSLYRIMRSPRALPGEQVVRLPTNVGVDLGLSGTLSCQNQNPPQPFQPQPNQNQLVVDILFSPGGAVLLRSGMPANDVIVLWVRDYSYASTGQGNPTMQGMPTLLAVQVRTGFIAAHPVSQTGDPYQFVRDNRTSGM